jgi:hypothetical protein
MSDSRCATAVPSGSRLAHPRDPPIPVFCEESATSKAELSKRPPAAFFSRSEAPFFQNGRSGPAFQNSEWFNSKRPRPRNFQSRGGCRLTAEAVAVRRRASNFINLPISAGGGCRLTAEAVAVRRRASNFIKFEWYCQLVSYNYHVSKILWYQVWYGAPPTPWAAIVAIRWWQLDE